MIGVSVVKSGSSPRGRQSLAMLFLFETHDVAELLLEGSRTDRGTILLAFLHGGSKQDAAVLGFIDGRRARAVELGSVWVTGAETCCDRSAAGVLRNVTQGVGGSDGTGQDITRCDVPLQHVLQELGSAGVLGSR